MNTVFVETIGYIAGFLTTVCLLPQLVKTLVTKSTKDVSTLTYLVLCVGQILWITYGVLIMDVRVIVANVVSLLFALLIIICCVYYTK